MQIESAVRRLWQGLTLAGALSQAACSSSTGPSGPPNGTFTAQIDGAGWSAATIVAGYQNGILSIAGTDGQQRTLGFAIGPAAAPGTFPVAITSGTNASFTVVSGSSAATWHAVQNSGSGTVTLTSISATHAVGTFSFTVVPLQGTGATGNKSITQGSFDVTY